MSNYTTTTSRRHPSTKHQQETIYENLFPAYESPYLYSVYFLNETTTEQDIDLLISHALAADHYFIDTESNRLDNSPALLQIYFKSTSNTYGLLLLLETKFLPSTSSSLFLKFQQLFSNIFKPTAHLHCWGLLTNELNKFVPLNIFSLPSSSKLHNLQHQFKSWFSRWIDRHYSSSTNDANPNVLIIDAPHYDPSLLLPTREMVLKKQVSNESWSLQHAILYTFGKYLSKKATLSKWNIGIDQKLPRRDLTYSSSYRNKLLNYACMDCISIAHLYEFMTHSTIPFDIDCPTQTTTSGKSKSKRKKNVISVLVQLTDEDSSSSEIYLNQIVTIHEKNECHQTSAPMDQPGRTLYECLQPASSIVPVELPPQESKPISPHFPTTSRSHRQYKRSKHAQQRRNKKTNLRHRANRYNYELIRQANMTITSIKKLLRERHLKYTNINIVRSTLYIGVKSAEQQKLYEQLIPADMFL